MARQEPPVHRDHHGRSNCLAASRPRSLLLWRCAILQSGRSLAVSSGRRVRPHVHGPPAVLRQKTNTPPSSDMPTRTASPSFGLIDAGKAARHTGRDALQDLLRYRRERPSGLQHNHPYDVSRVGDAQQPDEGAYYEFRCIRANITRPILRRTISPTTRP
jgi:hypothetical protein